MDNENTTVADAPEQAAETLLGGEQNAEAPTSPESVVPEQQTHEEKTAEGEKSETEKPQDAVPEKYEFKAVEGNEIAPDVLEHFAGVAKELGLSQDKAQLVLDKMVPMLQARQVEQIAQVHQQWAEQSKADKELGGGGLAKNLAVAKQALDAYGTPELVKLLNETGLGNHPEVIRFCLRAGKNLSEDKVVKGSPASTKTKDPASLLYDNSDMK